MKDGAIQIRTPKWILPLLKPCRYKGAYGGRGSGKSFAFAQMLLEDHIINPNLKSVCVREVQRSLERSVKSLLEDQICAFGVDKYFTSTKTSINSNFGSGIIIFEGMQDHTADSIKSLNGYDRAWVEEAQCLSMRSLDLLRPTIRKDSVDGYSGSEIWFTWNPENEDDAVDSFLRCETPPKDSIVVSVNYFDNPWFPDVLREEMEYDKKRDLDKYSHVWLGNYCKASNAAVFKNWEVSKFESVNSNTFYFGADFGFSNTDPTVLIRCYFDGIKLFVDYEAVMISCEIPNIPQLFCSIPEAEKWPIIADSSRPETIQYLRTNGFPKILSSVKGAGSIEDGISFLKGYDIIVHERCTHLINELKKYQYKIDRKSGEILPIVVDKNNHCIDALRYACESIRRLKSNDVKEFTPIAVFNKW
jgi:phage terminase large subunit